MSAIFFVKLVGVLACLTGHSFARFWHHVATQVQATPGPKYYEKFQTVPDHAVTAKKFETNFLRIPSAPSRHAMLTKRQATPPGKEDVVVVMDGSGSIGSCEFKKGKKALKYMMDAATEAAIKDTQYAAVTFATSASVNFNFVKHPPAGSEFMRIPYPDGMTNTQAGLAEAMNLFKDPSSGRRVYSDKKVLLVTDGHSNTDSQLTIPNAAALKSIGVKIFVVAVGDYITGIDEMVKVASYPHAEHLFRVKKLSGFLQVIGLVLEQVAPDKYRRARVKDQYDTPC